jgi:RHS repeat-associated protein
VTPQTGSSPSTSSYYYHTDHQGSVRAITNDAGQVTNAYAYDSYGTAQESVESLAQRFRYTGREYDALTGLYHYRARAYDPETARFLQEDPLGFAGGDINLYRYALGNPVKWIDPTGQSATEQGAIDGNATKVAPSVYNTARQIACNFSTIAGVLSVISGGVGYAQLEIISDVDIGCGAKTKEISKVTFNQKTGKQIEDFIKEVLSGPAFDCKDKTKSYQTSKGRRIVDAVICIGDDRINIEIKGTIAHIPNYNAKRIMNW